MTADVIQLHSSRDDYEDQVRASIRAVMAARGLEVDDLAEMTGLSRSTLFGRFAGKGATRAFYAGEVRIIAEALGVSLEGIYTGRLDLSVRGRSSDTHRYRNVRGNCENGKKSVAA